MVMIKAFRKENGENGMHKVEEVIKNLKKRNYEVSYFDMRIYPKRF